MSIRLKGPWFFVSGYRLDGHGIVWRARQVRKGLGRKLATFGGTTTPFWRTSGYNWWMGLLFALGSMLFMAASAFSLLPPGRQLLTEGIINVIFFAGSIPFTLAGYLQLFQAANLPAFAVEPRPETSPRVALIGWHPESAGWVSAFAQFIGTIQFNFNTYDALRMPNRWYVEDIAVWTPGMVGSVLFLVSGYLAFIETCGGYWRWRPRELDWRIVVWNLFGCIFFMTASILAFVPWGTEASWIPAISNVHLFLGAFCFLVGAALSMRESRQARPG